MHIVYFFTYGYSLESWNSAGILDRELKIFDKLMSMINIKSYTIEILQKTVNDIIEVNNERKNTDFECFCSKIAIFEQKSLRYTFSDSISGIYTLFYV